jgi:hypothetical protein
MPDTDTNNGHSQNGFKNPDKLDRDMVRWTRWVAVFTFLLVVVSGISDYFIWRQQTQATQAQEEAREQTRAFVGEPLFVPVAANDADGKPITAIELVFQNIGGTRTAWFRVWGSIHYFDDGVPLGLDLGQPWKQLPISDTVIGPSGNTILGPLAESLAKMNAAASGKGTLLLWARGAYADIYHPEVSHPISVCQVVDLKAKAPNAPAGNPPFTATGHPFRSDCNYSR